MKANRLLANSAFIRSPLSLQCQQQLLCSDMSLSLWNTYLLLPFCVFSALTTPRKLKIICVDYELISFLITLRKKLAENFTEIKFWYLFGKKDATDSMKYVFIIVYVFLLLPLVLR